MFSRSAMSYSLWPHGLQHARLSCLAPTPGACSNSCQLSQWCHPTISSSVIPFSSCLQSFPTSGSFLSFFLFLNEFIYFNWRLITLQYCGGFCHTLTWISHWCTHVPHPEPPSHFPPHPIPQIRPSAPALSTMSHASNLDWWSTSHMVVYMFQCYSLKSSHPCLLQQRRCSLHLCFFYCLTYRVMITIFLNSIYICVNILYWCFSFWFTSLCIIGSSFIHLIRTDSNAFFLIAE